MSDDDLDWGQLDQVLAKSQGTKSVATTVGNNSATTSTSPATTAANVSGELHLNYEKLKHDYNEMSRKLLAAHGETSILRANLERLQSARQIEVDAKIQKSVGLQEKYDTEVANLNREIEKLKSEKQFMINDQQQLLIEQKIRAKKLKHAHSPDVSPMQSPTTTPKKQQRLKDLGLDFGDGFVLSPRKRRKAEAEEVLPVQVVDEGDVVMKDVEAIDPGKLDGLVSALKASNKLSTFARLMFSHESRSTPLLKLLLKDDKTSMGQALLEGIMNGSTVGVFDNLKEMLDSELHSNSALIVPLLHTTMTTDPSVLLDGMDSLFKAASHAVFEYMHSTNIEVTYALYNLDLIRSMLISASYDPALLSKAWGMVNNDFFSQLLLDPPVNIFAKTLALFALSGYDQSRASIIHDAMVKAFSMDVEPSTDLLYLTLFNDASGADEYFLIESSNFDKNLSQQQLAQEAARLQFGVQGIENQSVSEDVLEKHAAEMLVGAFERIIRIRAAKLVTMVYASKFTEYQDTPRLVTAIINRLSTELDRLYDYGFDMQQSDSSQVEVCIWSLHCIYSFSPNVAALLSKLGSRSTREQLVALSRVAMGEDSVEDVPDSMFDRQTVDRAVELLEQITTSKEVEELYEFYDAA